MSFTDSFLPAVMMSFLSRLFPGILHGESLPFPSGEVTTPANKTLTQNAAKTIGTLVAIVLPGTVRCLKEAEQAYVPSHYKQSLGSAQH
jgi:hypothetical protein